MIYFVRNELRYAEKCMREVLCENKFLRDELSKIMQMNMK